METFSVILASMAMVLGVVLLVCVLTGLPVMWLWNLLMPQLFNLPTITFWQAVGLSLLCSMLFKSNTSTTSKASK